MTVAVMKYLHLVSVTHCCVFVIECPTWLWQIRSGHNHFRFAVASVYQSNVDCVFEKPLLCWKDTNANCGDKHEAKQAPQLKYIFRDLKSLPLAKMFEIYSSNLSSL